MEEALGGSRVGGLGLRLLRNFASTLEYELTPVGQKEHHAVEADHEEITELRYTVDEEHNLTGLLSTGTPVGPGKHETCPAK